MKPYWEKKGNKIFLGHVLEVLKTLPKEFVHMCVTSPPYWGLRNYGLEPQTWDDPGNCSHEWGDDITHSIDYVQGNVEFARPHSKLKSFTSSSSVCSLCGAWRGSLGLEPTPELFIQHVVQIFKEIKRVLRKDGTVWINLGDSYNGSGPSGGLGKQYTNKGSQDTIVKKVSGLKPKDLCGIPWRVALALQADGWCLRSDIIWNKLNPMPESVTDRPTKSHEYVFLLTKSQKYFYDSYAVMEPNSSPEQRLHNLKYTKNYDNAEAIAHGQPGNVNNAGMHSRPGLEGRNRRSVWTMATECCKEAHFATFPKKLVEPCILAGTSEKGCCPECGKPWVRILIQESISRHELPKNHKDYRPKKYPVKSSGRNDYDNGGGQAFKSSEMIGWEPGCKCLSDDCTPGQNLDDGVRLPFDPIPCTVLEPFLGSAPVGQVCIENNRKFIGIELSKEYVDTIAIPKVSQKIKRISRMIIKPWNRGLPKARKGLNLKS